MKDTFSSVFGRTRIRNCVCFAFAAPNIIPTELVAVVVVSARCCTVCVAGPVSVGFAGVALRPKRNVSVWLVSWIFARRPGLRSSCMSRGATSRCYFCLGARYGNVKPRRKTKNRKKTKTRIISVGYSAQYPPSCQLVSEILYATGNEHTVSVLMG